MEHQTRSAPPLGVSTARVVPSRLLEAGGLRMRVLDWPGGAPPLLLLHGLSANANEFAALGARLAPAHRVVAPDLRGRGGTDKPATGYTMADHAADVLALLDALGLDRVVLGGHSFGALLAAYVAAHHPARVERLVMIDAAIRLHPRVREMVAPSVDRLRRTFASAEAYLDELRHAPYMDGTWDWSIESYFRAEIETLPDGTVRPATSADAIAQCMQEALSVDWAAVMARVPHPVLVLNATADYGPPGTGALVPEDAARETAASFRDGRYVKTSGNHLTMVFGDHAAHVCDAIERFLGAVEIPIK